MDRMGHIRRFRQRAGSLAIFLSVLLLALPGTAQATAGWQTYTHPQMGFSLSYPDGWAETNGPSRSEEHTSELQSHHDLVCRLLLEKKKSQDTKTVYYTIET